MPYPVFDENNLVRLTFYTHSSKSESYNGESILYKNISANIFSNDMSKSYFSTLLLIIEYNWISLTYKYD